MLYLPKPRMEERQMLYSLEGMWKADLGDGRRYDMKLPGTLDESGIGGPDEGKDPCHPDGEAENGALAGDEVILTRFTRKHTFEGEARLTSRVCFELPPGKRVFLEAERARCLRLLLDGQEIPPFREPSVSTPQVFELTKHWRRGAESGYEAAGEDSHELTLLSDNSYPGMPRADIVYSSAATDETQTNWNGVLGYLRLRLEEPVFLEAVRVYPAGDRVTVKMSVCADAPWRGRIGVCSGALGKAAALEAAGERGRTEIVLEGLTLAETSGRWDEYEGKLQELTVRLEAEHHREAGEEGSRKAAGRESLVSEKTVSFGIRDFGADERGRLALNGRSIFLRGETNCAVFPETGYCPMSEEAWREILKTYRSYGVNCVRFHSHCPPEAAFAAADRMGMLMQPELSCWNPRDAFETEESFECYRRELTEILRMLANHPSFVMLTFGNELQLSERGLERMRSLLALAKELDSTRLYAGGSNLYYGGRGCDEDSDFYTAQSFGKMDLRGTFMNMEGYINRCYPDGMHNYDKTVEKLRETCEKPVFGFEAGQFEVLPDFRELEEFRGITDPANLRRIRERVEERGLTAVWDRYVEATGELALICYREEVEAVLRTEGMSGISLLGLQDFPGQGTALVGMLNAHLEPKPFSFARPEAFRAFFRPCQPLALLSGYTYETRERLTAEIKVANYGKEALEGELCCNLVCGAFEREFKGGWVSCPAGKLTAVGRTDFSLEDVPAPARLELTVAVGDVKSRCFVWVYPPVRPVCPETVHETAHFDGEAERVLEAGGTVYLTPPSTKEALPLSVQAQFSTDFWSVGTFSGQAGTMGQLIRENHPIFRDFPTEFHTDWQWWPMASSRAVLLPGQYESIVTMLDSYAYLRPLTQLLECRCGSGRLLFSSMGLQDLQEYPEARALLASVYRYLGSPDFEPAQEIGPEVWRKLVV